MRPRTHRSSERANILGEGNNNPHILRYTINLENMSYRQLFYHIVFRTKSSSQAIAVEKEEMLYRYIWGFAKNKGAVLYRIGGMPDHIHMFADIPPTVSIADFMRDLKTSSSVFLSSHAGDFPRFKGWAKSYCIISYSLKDKDKIIGYIANQKEHHKKASFMEELLCLLLENGIDVDVSFLMED